MPLSCPRWKNCRRCTFVVATLVSSLLATNSFADESTSGSIDPSFWSRVTVELPVFTRHVTNDEDFNDKNWGAFVDFALSRRWSVVAGDFKNSYNRNTVFAAIAYYPLNLTLSQIMIDTGAVIGVDLNGGYKHFNRLDPLLGALSIKIGSANLEGSDVSLLNRLGLAVTIIPAAPNGGSTAVNLAVTFRL